MMYLHTELCTYTQNLTYRSTFNINVMAILMMMLRLMIMTRTMTDIIVTLTCQFIMFTCVFRGPLHKVEEVRDRLRNIHSTRFVQDVTSSSMLQVTGH